MRGLLLFLGALVVLVCLPVRRTGGDLQPGSVERRAIRAIQTIHTAEVQYNSQYGRYAVSLVELGPPAGGAASAAAADLIGNDLANGTKQGYRFTLTSSAGGYVVNANPVTYGSDGNESYYSDQTMVIRENAGPEPATAASKELGSH